MGLGLGFPEQRPRLGLERRAGVFGISRGWSERQETGGQSVCIVDCLLSSGVTGEAVSRVERQTRPPTAMPYWGENARRREGACSTRASSPPPEAFVRPRTRVASQRPRTRFNNHDSGDVDKRRVLVTRTQTGLKGWKKGQTLSVLVPWRRRQSVRQVVALETGRDDS